MRFQATTAIVHTRDNHILPLPRLNLTTPLHKLIWYCVITAAKRMHLMHTSKEVAERDVFNLIILTYNQVCTYINIIFYIF